MRILTLSVMQIFQIFEVVSIAFLFSCIFTLDTDIKKTGEFFPGNSEEIGFTDICEEGLSDICENARIYSMRQPSIIYEFVPDPCNISLYFNSVTCPPVCFLSVS
jgi:hypothetical protein